MNTKFYLSLNRFRIFCVSLLLLILATHLQAQPGGCTPTPIFSENFDNISGITAGGPGTYAFPTGWLLANVDNNIPDVPVSYVNDAWERREDFANNVADSAMFSTSWYNPLSSADDWAWTPAIGPITANAVLNWNALTYDPLFPDGYEVRVMTSAGGPPNGSTGNIGNMVANSTVLFSISAENTTWTARTASLAAFAGQTIYIAFRNNSNDKFLLVIDDVVVTDIIPSAEVCNGIDDDCNGLVDDGLLFTTFYADTDGDTYGDPSSSTTSCEGSLAGYVTNNTDCNDGSAAINPGATEVCNNLIDDNCDGQTDENCITYTYYLDNDLDGYGDPAVTTISSNPLPPAGYVADNTDCDDNNIAVNPGATEICNGIDDNCDGITDIGSVLAAGPITGPGSQCMPVQTGSGTFSIAAVPGAISYSWSVPSNMNILSGQGTTSIFVSWTPFAVHDGIVGNITVSPVDNCGAGQSSSLAIDINYTAPVRPSSISGPVRLCPGDIGTYSVFPVARASSYQWNLPAGLTISSGAGTNIISVSADNSFAGGTISCSAVNVCGASPVRTRTTLLNTPTTPSAISGFANGLCGATGVAYSVALLPMASGYTWSVPAGATIMDGQGTNSILVDFDANFTSGAITVTGNNGCGDGPARSLTVKGAPGVASPIIGDISICNGQVNVKYEVNTVAGAGNYQWTVPTGVTLVSGQGTKEIFVNYGATTASGLQISVITSNSCGNSTARVLNGIVVNPANCIRVGDNSTAIDVSVFPNPAHSNTLLRFNMFDNSPYQLNLTDVSGRIIYSQKGSSTVGMNQIEMNVEQYASGIYFVELQSEGLTKSVKLIIE
jgi:hypothetical protein